MKFFSKVTRWCDLSKGDLFQLFGWLGRSRSTVETQNPNVLVASARNEHGEPVAYTCAEPTFLVSGFAVSPAISEKQAQLAGDAMDKEIVQAIQQSGASRVLLVLPEHAPKQVDEVLLRVIVRHLPQSVETQEQKYGRFLAQQQPATHFIN